MIIRMNDKEKNVLKNSRTLSFFEEKYKRAIYLLKLSLLSDYFNKFYCGLRGHPVKVVSLILITAILSSFLLSLILKIKISYLGFYFRLFFLVLCFSGLFCNADWEKLKNGSFIFKILKKRKPHAAS